MCIVMYVLLQYTVLQQFEVLQLQNHFDQQVAVCFSILHCFVLFFKSEESVYYIQRGLYIYIKRATLNFHVGNENFQWCFLKFYLVP